MAVGDVHLVGPGGWPLCDASGPVRGYNATSQPCRDCDAIVRDGQSQDTQAPIIEAASPRTFRVINGDNGYGLSRDRDIVSAAFCASNWRRIDHGLAIVNVHLERINPRMLGSARHNVVIPNPEWWCAVGNIGVEEMNLALIDPSVTVWVKTRDAERIFRNFGARVVEYKGFTSADRMDSTVPRRRDFLHVAGEGPNKRTDRLLDLWRPEWPLLTITCKPNLYSANGRKNVRVISDRLSDKALRDLQNQHAFHIYPSRYEGFGHAQWEGLSCGAIVFVCDGPPFEEHANVFQLLAAVPQGSPDWNSSILWRHVQAAALADGVAWAQNLPDEQLLARCQQARADWEAAHSFFIERLHAAVSVFDQEFAA